MWNYGKKLSSWCHPLQSINRLPGVSLTHPRSYCRHRSLKKYLRSHDNSVLHNYFQRFRLECRAAHAALIAGSRTWFAAQSHACTTHAWRHATRTSSSNARMSSAAYLFVAISQRLQPGSPQTPPRLSISATKVKQLSDRWFQDDSFWIVGYRMHSR